MPGPSSLTIRTFQDADAEPLAALLRASLAAGEQSGHTASDFEGLIGAFPIARNFLVADIEGTPVGLICSDYRLLVVRPESRRRGVGRGLVEAMERALDSTPDGPLILFPPHGNSGALAFLKALGFRYDHSTFRFRLGPDRIAELPTLPSGLSLATYRVEDLEPYIELINSAFEDHPTPLRVTREQVEHVHAKVTFDPAAIAIVRNPDGQMVGFCTTGIDRGTDPAVGSINLVGVLQPYRGRGLGRYLLIWGIERLQSLGLETIELSVDADNERAVELYRSVGFQAVEDWPQWMRSAAAAPRDLSGNVIARS